MPEPVDVVAQLAALRAGYANELPKRLATLREGLQRILHGPWDPVLAATTHRQVHSLTGSGATFGFEAVSLATRKLELLLKSALYESATTDAAWRDAVESSLRGVEEAVLKMDKAPAPNFVSAIARGVSVPDSTLVYLVEDDEPFAAEWTAQLRYYGFDVRHVSTLAALEKALLNEIPAVILMDEMLPDGHGTEYMLRRRQTGSLLVPVILISATHDFKMRLEAVRAGAAFFLPKPLDLSVLVDRVSAILSPDKGETYRVLLVEDDAQIAAYHAALLRGAGMVVDIVPDPLVTMECIDASAPDLLILDMNMPDCSGIELANVLRQQDAYASLPIVFLSSETDSARQLLAIETGGDDFLVKPVAPEWLVASVRARVKRARTVRALMTHDSLTGLLNHSTIKSAIAREHFMAQRTNRPFSVVLIDVDHFKNVNDQHGHQVGDRTLKSLARLLVQRLRRSDLVGRYGGEEFIAVLPNTDQESAWQVIDRIRADFASIGHHAGQAVFVSTFSAGISTFVNGPQTVSELINDADKALYAAKHAGRNRVQRAEP